MGVFPQSRDSLGYLPLQLALKARLQRATKALVGGMASFTAISSIAGLQGCAFCLCLPEDSRRFGHDMQPTMAFFPLHTSCVWSWWIERAHVLQRCIEADRVTENPWTGSQASCSNNYGRNAGIACDAMHSD